MVRPDSCLQCAQSQGKHLSRALRAGSPTDRETGANGAQENGCEVQRSPPQPHVQRSDLERSATVRKPEIKVAFDVRIPWSGLITTSTAYS